MAGSPDEMRARIEAYPWPPRRGGVEVVRANRGYTLYSRRTGAPVARLRPTGQGESGRQGAGAVVATGGLGQPGTLRP
jgi:hypothetical protein